MATGANDNFNNDLNLSDYPYDDVWFNGQEPGIGAAASDDVQTTPNLWNSPPSINPLDLYHGHTLAHSCSPPLPLQSSPAFSSHYDAGPLYHSAPPDERSFDALMLQHLRDASWTTILHNTPASWTEHSHVPTSQDFPILETDLFHQADGLESGNQLAAVPMATGFSNLGEYIPGYDPTNKAPSILSAVSAGSIETAPEDVMSVDANNGSEAPDHADLPRSAPIDIARPANAELSLFEYAPTGSEGALVRQPTAAGKRPRGRCGPLSATSKANAAKMRKLKACKTCKYRKLGVRNSQDRILYGQLMHISAMTAYFAALVSATIETSCLLSRACVVLFF